MIEVKYKCYCQNTEQTIFILSRGKDEPLKTYMPYMQRQISMHHSDVSPRCKLIEMEYAKLYVAPDGTIGGEGTKQ